MKPFLLIILTTLISFEVKAQWAGQYPRIFSKTPSPWSHYMEDVKVKDIKPVNCWEQEGCNGLQIVFEENFDHNFDLPNKWRFFISSATEGIQNKSTWYGDSYYNQENGEVENRNISLNNGFATINFLQDGITRGGIYYKYTSGAFESLSKFRTGIMEARIKIPTAHYMWPAFWLLGEKPGSYREIDIFENYAGAGSNDGCSEQQEYAQHKMTLHTGTSSSVKEQRRDKYPINTSQWHTYKLVWESDEIFIFVDDILKGYATKYGKGLSYHQHCQYGFSGNWNDWNHNYRCEQVNVMDDYLIPPRTIHIGWPFNHDIHIPGMFPKEIQQHTIWPNRYDAMQLIVNNAIHESYITKNTLLDNGYTQESLNMQIDWIKVWQPTCCDLDVLFTSRTNLDNFTYGTDIVVAKKITICNPNHSNTFLYPEPFGPIWRDQPIVLLASDEIAINDETIFAGNQYVEARIQPCIGTRRENNNEQEQIDTFYTQQDSIMDSENEQASDSLMEVYNAYVDSIVSADLAGYGLTPNDTIPPNGRMAQNVSQNTENSDYLNSEITVAPVPSSDFVIINASESNYQKIKTIHLQDVNGKVSFISKERKIGIKNLEPGMYFLRIELFDGTILNKKIIKI